MSPVGEPSEEGGTVEVSGGGGTVVGTSVGVVSGGGGGGGWSPWSPWPPWPP